MNDKEKTIRLLERKAFGYTVEEETIEYDSVGCIVKRKTVLKEVPPDVSAIRLLFELRHKNGFERELLSREDEE